MAGSRALNSVEAIFNIPRQDKVPPDWVAKGMGMDMEKRIEYIEEWEKRINLLYEGGGSFWTYDTVYGLLFNIQLADSFDTDKVVAAFETQTPYVGALSSTFWFKSPHRRVLPRAVVQFKTFDDAGNFTLEYMGAGQALNVKGEDFDMTIGTQIDCKAWRNK